MKGSILKNPRAMASFIRTVVLATKAAWAAAVSAAMAAFEAVLAVD